MSREAEGSMRNRTAIVGLGLVGTLLAATAIAADPVPIPLTVTLSPAPARLPTA